MCPGCTRSSGTAVGSAITWMVRARSAALMPVVMPRAASTLTWKSVLNVSRFCTTIRSTPSCCNRSAVVGTQINPRPNLAMKLTASAVACSAAMIKSPSFSRSASSTTITIWPFRKSSMTPSMVSNPVFIGCRSIYPDQRQLPATKRRFGQQTTGRKNAECPAKVTRRHPHQIIPNESWALSLLALSVWQELTKQQRRKIRQVPAPDRPAMVAFGFVEFVADISLLQQIVKLSRVFHQPIVLPAGDPEQFQFFVRQLWVGEGLAHRVFRVADERAESADPSEQFGMVQPDGQRLAAAHRKAGNRPARGLFAH